MIRRRNRGLGSISGPATTNSLKKVGSLAVGMAIGTLVNNYLNKMSNNGETVTGLDGTTSRYLVPIVLGAAGVIGNQMIKNDFGKDICTGVAVSGAASLINKATNKTIIALAGDEMIPGLGDADVTYQQLPVYSGVPQQAYEVAEPAVVDDASVSTTDQGYETVSGVDDDNYFIA